MQNVIKQALEATRATLDTVLADKALLGAVEEAAKRSIAALQAGKKIMFAGNGGSAADSQHMAAELVSRYNYDRPGLPAIALTTDTSALTAIGNDYHYDRVFSRQIEALGQEGDVFFGISTSGNSANVIAALEAAKARGITTIGLTGKTGGKMAALCDVCIKIPATETPKVQECHIMLGHIICQLIEDTMFAKEFKPQQKLA